MSAGMSSPSAEPSTWWNLKTPSLSSSSASQTACVPGVLMKARRMPGWSMKRTSSAPLLVPRLAT